MIDLTAAVAIFEVYGIAALRRHLPACCRKRRLATVFHVVQVSDQRAHALAAAGDRSSICGIRRQQEIEMRRVERSHRIVEHLYAFAVLERKIHYFRDTLVETGDEWVLLQAKKHAQAIAMRSEERRVGQDG